MPDKTNMANKGQGEKMPTKRDADRQKTERKEGQQNQQKGMKREDENMKKDKQMKEK